MVEINAWRGVTVIVSGPSNGIRYCSRSNLVSVCGGMTVTLQVWWRPEERYEPAHFASRQISLTLGIMA
ncbi:hypothetical protein TNCV_1594881 [Trichonephila clavipes]|nr:hypothetical protein TNCV_1594881 [Trichonephila clavipes]